MITNNHGSIEVIYIAIYHNTTKLQQRKNTEKCEKIIRDN